MRELNSPRGSFLSFLLLFASLIVVTYQATTESPQNDSFLPTLTFRNEESEHPETETEEKNNKYYTIDEAADFCKTFLSDNGNSNERTDVLEEPEQVDLNLLLDEIEESSDAKKEEDFVWRVGSPESQNRHFLTSGLYSDITFVLGPDGGTTIVHAHKLFLTRSSPTFEAIFNTNITDSNVRRIRITDITPSNFNTLLEYIYSGELCFSTFDEACEMLSVATRFQMPDLAKQCHYYLWFNMYPKNMWRAYQCAVKANDTTMSETALNIIQRKTEQALMDSAFADIPQSTLVAFLQRDDLTVTSELALYEASLRWAMGEATRRGLPQDPDSLRDCLGPALQHIRFLTLTPNEFANIQYTSKILSYSESLAVIFNLNAPGVMPLPQGLSSSKKARNLLNDKLQYFEVLDKPASSSKCMNTNTSLDLIQNKNIYDAISTTVVKPDTLPASRIANIKVPKRQSISSETNCEYEDEDITIYMINSKNEIFNTQRYTTSCNDVQTKEKLDSETYNIKFTDVVYFTKSEPFTIKVVFHKPGRYPFSLGSEDVGTTTQYTYVVNVGHTYIYEHKLGKSNFIYSISSY